MFYRFLREWYPNAFWPRREDSTYPKELEHMTNIQLYCNDALHCVRHVYHRSEARFEGDLKFTPNCLQMMQRLANSVLNVLKQKDMKVYVFCLDPIGGRRPEKKETSKKREKSVKTSQDKGRPTKLVLPYGRDVYFDDTLTLPGDMELICRTLEAKKALYAYITQYFCSERFYPRIPEGKHFILSGATTHLIEKDEDGEQIPIPIRVDKNGVTELKDRKFRSVVSEGDLDVYHWLYVYPEMNAMIDSGDGDILIIGLMQMRRLHDKTNNRRVVFKTRRSNGSGPRSPEYIKWHNDAYAWYNTMVAEGKSKKEAYLMSKGVATPRITVIIDYIKEYVDISLLATSIRADFSRLREKYKEKPTNFCCTPVETSVAIIMMFGNDYIFKNMLCHQLNVLAVWRTFFEYAPDIGEIVSVIKKTRAQKRARSGVLKPMHPLYIYEVNVLQVRKLIMESYRCRMEMDDKKRKENIAKKKALKGQEYTVTLAPPEEIMRRTQNMWKKHMPDMEKMRTGCAHLAWTMFYFSNDSLHDFEVPDSTKIVDEKSGMSVHGYGPDGIMDQVSPGDIRRAM